MTKKISNYFFFFGVTLLIIRTVNLFIMHILKDTAIMDVMVNDALHHYHYALIIMLIGIVVHFAFKVDFVYFALIFLAAVIDEYSVIQYELFNSIPKYLYGTRYDNILIYGISFIALIAFLIIYRKKSRDI